MARGKKHSPEQVVNLLRQIEVAIANGDKRQSHWGPAIEAENVKDLTLVDFDG
jgi:hypothetical protein